MTTYDASPSGIPGRLSGMLSRLAPSVNAVLFVDPDLESTRRLAVPLREHCALAVVGSAHEAMEAMRKRMPTMVVTELQLPDTDGAQWISTLRHSPATHQVLLMVVTWRSTVWDKIAAFQSGADEFLVKPVEPEVFLTHFGLLSRFRQVIGMR